MIASRDIGKSNKKLTIRQNGTPKVWEGDKAPNAHQPNSDKPALGVDMLADNNIYVKGMDSEDGQKMNTNVCAMIARKGDIDAEFSGDTYIGETTAANNIKITTRGKHMYIDNLGQVPSYPQDYYGPNTNTVPNKVTLKALDLGSYWDENEKPNYEHAADSTIVVKNGRINGKGEGRTEEGNADQDLIAVADNVYAGGYYFNTGKHRGENGKSSVTKDDTTNAISNTNGGDASIRVSAVRPDDVKEVGGATDNKTAPNKDGRNYYYGGSEQGDDPNYDIDGKLHLREIKVARMTMTT